MRGVGRIQHVMKHLGGSKSTKHPGLQRSSQQTPDPIHGVPTGAMCVVGSQVQHLDVDEHRDPFPTTDQ